MALTLVEANKLSNDVLDKGIIETIVRDSPVFHRLKFMEISGNGFTYNRENTEPGAAFYDVGDVWVESTGTYTSVTAQLRILGGDADVDNFLQKTRSDTNDQRQIVLTQKLEKIRDTYLDSFYYGDNAVNSKEFSGLHALLTSTVYNTVHAGAGTGTALSIDKLREAIDLIKGRRPDLIISSKKMRRLVTTYLESVGSGFPADRDDFGMRVRFFDEIPWAVDDNIVDTETAASGAYSAKTGGANTSIFILRFDPLGVMGLQSGGIQRELKLNLESKDASRIRIKWYCSLMMKSLIACAKVDGAATGSAVTA